MPHLIEIVTLPHERQDVPLIRRKAAQQTGLSLDEISHVEILKASLDARSRQPVYRLRAAVYPLQEIDLRFRAKIKHVRNLCNYRPCSNKRFIVGF